MRIKEFGGTPPLDALAHRQSPAPPNATEQIDAARMSARRVSASPEIRLRSGEPGGKKSKSFCCVFKKSKDFFRNLESHGM